MEGPWCAAIKMKQPTKARREEETLPNRTNQPVIDSSKSVIATGMIKVKDKQWTGTDAIRSLYRIRTIYDTVRLMSGSQCELIVYHMLWHPSVCRPSVRCQPFSKVFFSETDWPIKSKFHAVPPWIGGTKLCLNGPCHMTKMATTSIYGKNVRISFS